MKASETQLSVWSGNNSACIKVSGRANFSASVAFKSAMAYLQQRGCTHFVLDLTDCLLMDSTFVGVLAGLGRAIEHGSANTPQPPPSIQIFNPNERVQDLLDNLGVTGLLKIVQGPLPDRGDMTEVKLQPGTTPGRLELSETCLEAHRTLSDLNPKNASVFHEVTRCLEEELRRQRNESR